MVTTSKPGRHEKGKYFYLSEIDGSVFFEVGRRTLIEHQRTFKYETLRSLRRLTNTQKILFKIWFRRIHLIICLDYMFRFCTLRYIYITK